MSYWLFHFTERSLINSQWKHSNDVQVRTINDALSVRECHESRDFNIEFLLHHPARH